MDINKFNLSKTVKEIKIEDISLEDYLKNEEINIEEIKENAAYIKKFGISLPVVVRKNIKDNKYLLIFGHKDFLSLKFLGRNSLSALILPITEIESKIIFLNYNKSSNQINYFKEAALYFSLLKKGSLSGEELAELLNTSFEAVKNKLELLTLCKEDKEFLIKHNLSFNFARKFIKASQKNKEKLKNFIIINNPEEKSALKFLKNLETEKKPKIINGIISDDRIILNSFEKTAKSLLNKGINGSFEKLENDTFCEYILRVNNSPKQLKMDI